MWRLFLESQWRQLRLGSRALWPPAGGMGRRSPRRILVMLAVAPALFVLNLYHWLGLALDEVLFRGYRKVDVKRPLFVVGVPRSGTTFLHGVLAEDEHNTTFATWECFFALSVTWRKLWRFAGRLDAALGRPVRSPARLPAAPPGRVLRGHPPDPARVSPRKTFFACCRR